MPSCPSNIERVCLSGYPLGVVVGDSRDRGTAMTVTTTVRERLTDADGYVDVRWLDLCERLIAEFVELPRGLVLDTIRDSYQAAHLIEADRRDRRRIAVLIARDAMLSYAAINGSAAGPNSSAPPSMPADRGACRSGPPVNSGDPLDGVDTEQRGSVRPRRR
jgi:hypothetical protein